MATREVLLFTSSGLDLCISMQHYQPRNKPAAVRWYKSALYKMFTLIIILLFLCALRNEVISLLQTILCALRSYILMKSGFGDALNGGWDVFQS